MSTPIRIRGKNKHRPSKKSEQTSTTSNSSRSLSQRTRGRPLSLSESSPSSTLSARPRSTPLKGTLKRQRVAAAQRISKKRKMHLSALEALPAELLQTIFIMSMNLNLPHASPRLASILSSDHVYMQLCLVAFGGDETVLGLPEVSATRSAILGQPWLTFDLLQRCEAKHFEDNKTIGEKHGI